MSKLKYSKKQNTNQLQNASNEAENQSNAPAATQQVATATVQTQKAARYLKALCNHFARKVDTSYDDQMGQVHFPFGECTLQVTDDALQIRVSADSADTISRVKFVVADHLVRFGNKEDLQVNWVDA
jgi:hypothetical protein